MRALVLLWVCLALRASASFLTCPKEMSGFEGDSVTLRCTYGRELRAHTKYWCKEVGLFISRCSSKIFVGENRPEATEGRVSIRDDPQELALTVTLRDLVKKDAGEYWCGVQKLGRDEEFRVSLTVFPGAERPGATTRACCPSSPAPSFRPLPATTASLQPRAGARPPQPPEPTSPDCRPTVATTQQGHGRVEASPHTETATSRHTATPRRRATSPHAAAASPPAGSSRPATVPDASSPTGDPGPVSGSLSSMSSMHIPAARLLAPVLVLLSLLLATGLIALGTHLLRGRKSGPRTGGNPLAGPRGGTWPCTVASIRGAEPSGVHLGVAADARGHWAADLA
ncbi:CMRF35-like molecule 9 isoform X2 [Octodon degus]|uniref:CMRF35-like molecule 9 isoform X2 n=1 Tax=Octodon degus TaxID=10160 RepID=A0A6P6ENV4_OCTDE|nr:CMRF35-like molecule 9 isoform X2 [Octodon degus]